VSFAIQKWLRLLLLGIRFIFASAALLLFGIKPSFGRPSFPERRGSQPDLQFLGVAGLRIVLIGVVVFLAARRISNDSTLLVVLESIVLFVPFILVTQAAMIGKEWHYFCVLLAPVGRD